MAEIFSFFRGTHAAWDEGWLQLFAVGVLAGLGTSGLLSNFDCTNESDVSDMVEVKPRSAFRRLWARASRFA